MRAPAGGAKMNNFFGGRVDFKFESVIPEAEIP